MIRVHLRSVDSNGFTVYYEDLVVSPEQLGSAFRVLSPLTADSSGSFRSDDTASEVHA
ncbi:hypothetical protein [Microbacterium sp.]|uniref:hypothetical protein n=1 Tax=Microbacterium sp. TaxID=51671 RepID=UPI0025CECA9F|nr:hypothetical protein [Microbacterium sp.]MBT9605281.1 hypothetical protein [Microbacterium sp.]